ncbi:hypothetical protein H4R99_007754 [Coemansia sp. RSA 1722]|nr:hypothetical protein LPJ57_005102 [Coemansia sp. RSA 486]KAJ2225061.1 hypothetical protein IWW45_007959 [Coemansia sp. RSA 485]KAJ2588572.1 hypothetical protein H4R99_007754 [Coemansia sp. RSA 1722]
MPIVDLVARGVAGKFDSEQERISALEQLFQTHIDPVDNIDTMVIALGSAMFGVTFVFMVIAWIKYKYRPIRAKNLPLTTCMYFSGVLWFLGDIPMNGHVILKNGWAICKLWNIWIRVLFCFVYTAVLFSRCYALDRVFNQNKPTRGWGYYGPSITLFAFIVIYSIVTQAMPDRLTLDYVSDYELCTTTEGYVIVTLILLWINWVVIVVMMYRLRNIQSTFNEFYEFVFICFFGIAAMVKTTVVHFVQPKYPYIRGFRVAETLGDAVIINGIILLIMAYPVVMSIVRSQAYEREWLLRLRTDGLQDMYEANLNLRAERPVNYSRMDTSMFNHMDKVAAGGAAADDDDDDNDRYFDMQGFGHNIGASNAEMIMKMDAGYLPSDDMPHSPRSNTNNIANRISDNNIGGGGGGTLRHYDAHSVDSMDTIDDSAAKPRRIL